MSQYREFAINFTRNGWERTETFNCVAYTIQEAFDQLAEKVRGITPCHVIRFNTKTTDGWKVEKRPILRPVSRHYSY